MRAILILLALSSPVSASGEAEWVKFRADVAAACTALIDMPGTPTVEVNPFGSARFGVALIDLVSETGTDRIACIYDKASKQAELTAPFGP